MNTKDMNKNQILIPSDAEIIVLALNCDFTKLTEEDAVKFRMEMSRWLMLNGWKYRLFLQWKTAKFDYSITGWVWCMIQNLRNASVVWKKDTNANQLHTNKPWDLSDPRHLSQLLQMTMAPDPKDPTVTAQELKKWEAVKMKDRWIIPEASLQVMEWHLWKTLHQSKKREELGLSTHSMLIVRAAVASSIVRLLRAIVFCKQEQWSRVYNVPKLRKSQRNIQRFLQYYANTISLTSREMNDLKNILYGAFLHLGDPIAAIYYHSDVASLQPPNMLLTSIFPAATAEKIMASMEVLKSGQGEVGKSIQRLDKNSIDLVLMFLFRLYFFRASSNGVDLNNYIVYWHEWVSEALIDRMNRDPPAGYKKTPFLCYVGSQGWFVWTAQVCYYAADSIEAIALFLRIVRDQSNVLDSTHTLEQFPPDLGNWKDAVKIGNNTGVNPGGPLLDENGLRITTADHWKRATKEANTEDKKEEMVAVVSTHEASQLRQFRVLGADDEPETDFQIQKKRQRQQEELNAQGHEEEEEEEEGDEE